MLNVSDISVIFGGEPLFEHIAFRLGAGDRVGLVGKNGAGKSTLLRLLAGEMQPDGGEIASDKGIKTGFLKQDIDFTHGKTVLEEAYEAFTEIRKLEKRLETINIQLAERTDYESESYHELMVELNELNHRYEILGGYHYQGSTEKVLQGLGFTREDFEKLTDTFSGGWRMRIELAKLLLQNNDVLLLDEPTNHLDIESIIWIESFLKNYSGAVVIVSHDKMFLDTVTNRTIEITGGKIYDYNKPYSQYKVLRETMRTQQLAAQKNQEKQIKHTEQLIDRFRAKASKASMAQSLIKKLERTDRIVVDEEDGSRMNIRFPASVRPGKVVVEVRNVSKRYRAHEVLKNINLLVARDSRIAFVGQNGQGKTTLARIIVGELPHEGQIKPGHNVKLGYFAQNQAEYLDGEATVLDTMLNAADDSNRPKVRDILGAFLFGGDAVDKKVKVLSGGERNRLALAKMLLQPFNVLVMDEPTNHLDMTSKNVLKQALTHFQGTLILVSHDRDFLQGLVNRVYEFKDRNIKEYLGGIEVYLEARNVDDLRAIEKKEKETASKKKPAGTAYETQKKIRSLRNRLSKVETQITGLEKQLSEIEVDMAADYDEVMSRPNFFEDYKQKKDKLEDLMNSWESLHEEIEKAASSQQADE